MIIHISLPSFERNIAEQCANMSAQLELPGVVFLHLRGGADQWSETTSQRTQSGISFMMKNAVIDGGIAAMHRKAVSGLDWKGRPLQWRVYTINKFVFTFLLKRAKGYN